MTYKHLIPLIFSISAGLSVWAEKPCLKILANDDILPAIESSNGEIASWLKERDFTPFDIAETFEKNADFERFLQDHEIDWNPLDRQARRNVSFQFIESRWRSESMMPQSRRSGLAYLDLVKLGMRGSGTVAEPFAIRETLKDLSNKNLNALLTNLHAHVDKPKVTAKQIDQIEDAVSSMDFQYIQRFPIFQNITRKAAAPLLSEREIGRMSLNPKPSFWNLFMNGSTSVNLEVAAMPLQINRNVPHTITHQSKTLDVVVDANWAEQEGYATPTFYSVKDLFGMFNSWRPDVLDQFLSNNRNLLTSDTLTREAFMSLSEEEMATLFPADDPQGRLLFLRRHLLSFVLTPDNLKTFLRDSVRTYLQNVYTKKGEAAGDAAVASTLASPYRMLRDVYTQLDMRPEWNLHIPGAVPAEQWSIAGNPRNSPLFKK